MLYFYLSGTKPYIPETTQSIEIIMCNYNAIIIYNVII